VLEGAPFIVLLMSRMRIGGAMLPCGAEACKPFVGSERVDVERSFRPTFGIGRGPGT